MGAQVQAQIRARARAQVQKKEKQYTKGQKAKMRVRVAKDVIKQIELGRFVALRGTHVLVRQRGEKLFLAGEMKAKAKQSVQSVREVFAKFKKCDVCAKGSLFIATIDRFNRTTIQQLLDDEIVMDNGGLLDDPTRAITWLFDGWQLNLIEYAFEGFEGHESVYGMPDRDDPAFIDDDDDRLVAIMRSVVENHGTFDSQRFADYCRDR